MSILKRLNRIIRSNVSELGSGGDTESLDAALGDMETSLEDARRQKATLRAQEKKLVAGIRQARDKADQWENRAMMALKKDEDDLARDALAVRNEALERAGRLREELEEHRMYLQDIDSALEALEIKLEGTRGRLRASSGPSRPRRRRTEGNWDAQFRRRVGGSRSARRPPGGSTDNPGDFEDDHLFDEVDRMGSKINAFEAQVQAMDELSDDNPAGADRQRLEERFRHLEDRDRRSSEGDEDDDLAALKKKFQD